jgi:hypothetical protein
LYYPKLDKKTSIQIWKNNIGRIRKEVEAQNPDFDIREREIIKFAKDHFKDIKDKKLLNWNGRYYTDCHHPIHALNQNLHADQSPLFVDKFATHSRQPLLLLPSTHGKPYDQMILSSVRNNSPESPPPPRNSTDTSSRSARERMIHNLPKSIAGAPITSRASL